MSSRLCFSVVIFVVAAGALAFRLPQLKQRPMHTDEAVHAEKFKQLLEEGEYQYDPIDYHGPTLNYFTLPIAQLCSAQTLVQTNETTLRLVPVIFAVGVVLLFLGLHSALGLWGALLAALLTAISPALVFYNRYYIQESLLVFFSFLTLVAGWQYIRTGKLYWALLAGVGMGLMHATKETCIIAYGSLFAALLVTAVWYQRTTKDARTIRSFINQKHLAAAIGVAMLVSVMFFTSFFQHPRGSLDSVLTYGSFFNKTGAPGSHDQPWYYYLRMLTYARYHDGPRWSEGLIVGLAILGFIWASIPVRIQLYTKKRNKNLGGTAKRPTGAWGWMVLTTTPKLEDSLDGATHQSLHISKYLPIPKSATGSLWFVRLIGVYTLLMVLVYSIIPYKTPWCMMGFLHGMILLAGWAAAKLIRSIPIIGGKIILCLLLAAGGIHLGWQAWRASFKLYDNSLNPYVYAHTVSDTYKLLDRVKALSASHPAGRDMHIEVICPGSDYWPLPWYFREFPTLACRDHVDLRSPLAPVVIISPDRETELITRIYERTPIEDRRLYIDDFYPDVIWLRPSVPLKLFVAQELWEADARRQQPSVEDRIQSKENREKKN